VCFGAFCGVIGLSFLFLLGRPGGILAQNTCVEQVPPVNRFALAIGALPMLETARIGGDAGSALGV
ncbi:MAG: hypothetical protein QOF94_1018, partial [Acidobacteriaceae bacterium]